MNEGNAARTYAVPTGRPYQLNELPSKIAVINDGVGDLWEGDHPAEYEPAAGALWQAFTTARALAPTRTCTGGERHPGAPTDPTADHACLFCVADERRHRDLRDGIPVLTPRATGLTSGRGPLSSRCRTDQSACRSNGSLDRVIAGQWTHRSRAS
ncbi:hypothetical protein P3T39_006714, partial [Kitasatospora sp. GP82]|nr:hypothetical protein [Kitasatospora sp. GP82]